MPTPPTRLLPGFVRRILGKVRSRERVRRSARFTTVQDGDPGTLDCCIAYNRFGGYCVPASSYHRPAAQAVLNGLVWEEDTIEFIREHGRQGDVVHAGTYFGDFLPAIARGMGPDRIVWAFEPNPESYRCARVTAWLNDLPNLRLHHAGLGEQRTALPIRTKDAAGRPLGGASTFAGIQESGVSGAQTVPVVPIDEIVPNDREVAILQFDVEGFEEQALKGAAQTLRRSRPIILLENIPRGEWFDEHVLGAGYREQGTIHDNTLFVHPDRPAGDLFSNDRTAPISDRS